VVAEDAVLEGERLVGREGPQRRDPLGHEPVPQGKVPQQAPLLAELYLRTELELARLSEVVEQGGGEQEVGTQARVERARLGGQGRDGDRVL
jgi:hypothetical protein